MDHRRTHLSRGDATLLSSHAGDPRTAAGDTTTDSQAKAGTRLKSQPAAEPRTYRSRRTPPPDEGDSLTEIEA